MLTHTIKAYPTVICVLLGNNPYPIFSLNIITTINLFQLFSKFYPNTYLSLNHEKARLLSLLINFVIICTELSFLFYKHGTLCSKGDLTILEGQLGAKIDIPVMTFFSLIFLSISLAAVPKLVNLFINLQRKKPVSQHNTKISLKPRTFTRHFMPRSNRVNLNDVCIDNLDNVDTADVHQHDNPAFRETEESSNVVINSSLQVTSELPLLEFRNTPDTSVVPNNFQETLEIPSILESLEYQRQPPHKQR